MSRISPDSLVRAIAMVRTMDMARKEQLGDEIFRAQPHLFGSFLVQKRMGVNLVKMDFLLEILFICFKAMQESGLTWPVITEDDLELQLRRYMAIVKFGDDLNETMQLQSTQQYIADHPEKYLFAFVATELAAWLQRIVPEESDKYVMMAAMNMVNCIAYADLTDLRPVAGH